MPVVGEIFIINQSKSAVVFKIQSIINDILKENSEALNA